MTRLKSWGPRLSMAFLVIFLSSAVPQIRGGFLEAALLPAQKPPLTIFPARFKPRGADEAVDVERGEMMVPELRSQPEGPKIPIRFLRFPTRSANPGPPIVYLAGGPGASGIAAAAGPRFALFDALRDVADVIALDQRGTGRSQRLPRCTTGDPVPLEMPTDRQNLVAVFAKQVRHCRGFWSSQGVNLKAYTTRESAADLVDLRRALDVPQLDLLAISYGTHLAMAALKEHPESFRRAVLVSPEGLDQSVKLPSETDGFFRRVQDSIDADRAARALYPDVAAMMRRVVGRAASRPVTVRVPTANGDADIVMGAFEIQRMAADRLADPPGTASVLAAFAAADRGDWSVLGMWAQRRTGEPIFLSPMSLAMDAASGVSSARRAEVQREAPAAILGDALGWPILHAEDALADLDLGGDFRSAFHSAHRVMIVSGTLDGRTSPEAHREVASRFDDPVFITLVNGGHNAALVTPEIRKRIQAFFLGKEVSSEPVTLDPPQWVPQG